MVAMKWDMSPNLDFMIKLFELGEMERMAAMKSNIYNNLQFKIKISKLLHPDEW